VYIKDVGDSSTILLRSDGVNTSIGTDSNHDLQIQTNGSTKMYIESGGNVGIGTTSPDAKLEVEGNINSGFYSVFAKNTNAGSSAFVSKKWLNDDAAFGEIWRNSSTRSSGGQQALSFNMYNSNDINFWSGASHTMALVGNNVGIGTDSPSYGKLQIDQTSGNNLTLRKGTGTAAVAFGGVTNNEATFLIEGHPAASGFKLYNGAGTLASPTWTAGMDFYDGGRLHPYGGVFLGSSNNSNLLDDYEEGTWTPVASDFSGNNATIDATNSVGVYTKIGDLVYWRCTIQMSSKGSMVATDTFRVQGFPFTSTSIPGNWYRPSSAIIKQCTFQGFVNFSWVSNTTYGYMFDSRTGAAGSTLFVSDISDNSAMSFTGVSKVQ